MKFTSLIKLLSLVFMLSIISCGDDDLDRDKFIGSWDGTLSGCSIDLPMIGTYSIPDLPMNMTFSEGSSDETINISVESSFFTTTSSTATVSGNTMTITPFDIELAAGPTTITMTLSGPGTYVNETTIDVDLNISAAGSETVCDYQLSKS